MLKILRTKKGQSMIGEYTLLIVIAVSAITAMTLFIRRAVQARIREARWYMQDTVIAANLYNPNGDQIILWREYEPYYLNSTTDTADEKRTQKQLEGGRSSGVFTKTINSNKRMTIISEQAPPKYAD